METDKKELIHRFSLQLSQGLNNPFALGKLISNEGSLKGTLKNVSDLYVKS
jgi:hypothetical protein